MSMWWEWIRHLNPLRLPLDFKSIGFFQQEKTCCTGTTWWWNTEEDQEGKKVQKAQNLANPCNMTKRQTLWVQWLHKISGMVPYQLSYVQHVAKDSTSLFGAGNIREWKSINFPASLKWQGQTNMWHYFGCFPFCWNATRQFLSPAKKS